MISNRNKIIYLIIIILFIAIGVVFALGITEVIDASSSTYGFTIIGLMIVIMVFACMSLGAIVIKREDCQCRGQPNCECD